MDGHLVAMHDVTTLERGLYTVFHTIKEKVDKAFLKSVPIFWALKGQLLKPGDS